MQECQCVVPGPSLTTPSVFASFGNYCAYASPMAAVLFDTFGARQTGLVASRTALAALASNGAGLVAILLKNGECRFYQLPFCSSCLFSLDLLSEKAKAKEKERAKANGTDPVRAEADRLSDAPLFESACFSPLDPSLFYVLDRRTNEVIVSHLETRTVRRFLLPTNYPVTQIHVVSAGSISVLLACGLNQGSIRYKDDVDSLAYRLLEETEKPFRSDPHTLTPTHTLQDLKFLPLGTQQSTQLTYDLMGRKPTNSLVYTTHSVTQKDVVFSTVCSISDDPFDCSSSDRRLLITFSCGTLLLYAFNDGSGDGSNSIPTLLGRRRIPGVTCAVFLHTHPGQIALGTSTGLVKLCSVNCLVRPQGTLGPMGLTDLSSLDDLVETDEKRSASAPLVVSRGSSIVCLHAMRPLKGEKLRRQENRLLNLSEFMLAVGEAGTEGEAEKGTASSSLLSPLSFLLGSTADGVFFVINCNQNSVYYRSEPGHVNTIMGVSPHPELFGVVATVSSDGTVKLWKETGRELAFVAQFGVPLDMGPLGLGLGLEKEKGGNIATPKESKIDGGALLASQGGLGPLLCGSWDPRPNSCLLLLSSHFGRSLIVDPWRGTIYSQLSPHAARVVSNAWTQVCNGLCATVGLDGVAKVYPLSRGKAYSATPGLGTVINNSFENNHIELSFDHVPLYSVSFSPHHPIMAIGASDGNVHLFDVGFLGLSNEQIAKRSKELGLRLGKTVPIPTIGVFQAHTQTCFRAIFHPLLTDIIATSSDDMTIRLFRFSLDGEYSFSGGGTEATGTGIVSQSLKITLLTTLRGHTSRVRPIVFHPELPHVILSGSWDATVRAWNWVAGVELARFTFTSDVYGIGVLPSHPFEALVSSRDITLRKIHLRGLELGIRPLVYSSLNALSLYFYGPGRTGAGVAISLEDVADLLCGTEQENEKACSLIVDAFASNCRENVETPLTCGEFRSVLTKSTGMEICRAFSRLSGKASQKCLLRLREKVELKEKLKEHSPLSLFGDIFDLFYPMGTGVQEFLRLADLLLFERPPKKTTFETAHKEFLCSNGYVATEQTLVWFAINLAKNNVTKLIGKASSVFQPDPDFSKARLFFYDFTRSYMASHSDIARRQVSTAIKIYVARGDFVSLRLLFELADYTRGLTLLEFVSSVPDELSLPLSDERPEKETPNNTLVRIGIETLVTPVIQFTLLAHILYARSKDPRLVCQAVYECCREGEICMAKLLVSTVKEVGLQKQLRELTSYWIASSYTSSRKPFLGAMELLVAGKVQEACRLLALCGESFPAACLALTLPEEADFMCLYGAAEIAVDCSVSREIVDLLLTTARGRSPGSRAIDAHALYLPSWFTYTHGNRLLRSLFYVRTLLLQESYTPYVDTRPLDSDRPLDDIFSFSSSPHAIFEQLSARLAPERFSFAIEAECIRLDNPAGSLTFREKVLRAVSTILLQILHRINRYVSAYIQTEGWEEHAKDLCILYNVVRGYDISADDVVHAAYALSTLVGGVAALNAGLFETAHQLFHGLRKHLDKSGGHELLPFPFDTLTLLIRKAAYCNTGNSHLAPPELEEEWAVFCARATPRRELAGGTWAELCCILRYGTYLRSFFTPFDRHMRPLLHLVPFTDSGS
ncbi:WD40 repeat protein [Giardia muris]|uniref:WD40 repeat protein n=1 Tax=Giardia muris TaxID=5742 RepID=A0A4Z1T218_GIAMU|nr:WD40 repeat protein [Giardia muris]|eukprot:TNJ26619.1 WD40 repeat protein [Giardia muris]